MNGTDPLAGLHPLREPAAVNWWPPAPGWWCLALLLLLALATLAWWLWRRYRHNAYRRQALAQLQHIRAELTRDGDAVACLASANALLKSVALRAYPRREVAATSGGDWRVFLELTLGETGTFEEALLVGQYRPAPPPGDLQRHLDSAGRWIRRHRRRL